MLSDDELDRYARHIILPHFGGAAQAKLAATRIAVIGAGGIGCPAIQYLAAAGVAALRIIDDDAVTRSNLQRQPLFHSDDIGNAKADVAAVRVVAINPHVDVTARVQRITSDTIGDLLHGVDLVIDGSDNFATRLLVSDYLTKARIPLVSAAVVQFQGQVGTFTGWRDDAPCYRCFVGDAHDADDCDSCADQGVLGPLAGMVGSFAAVEAVRCATGFGDDATGKLHVIDGLVPSMRALRLPKDPACRACG